MGSFVVEILVPVLLMSGIGAALAAVLVIAGRCMANYGPCKITINGEDRFTVAGGESLLSTLVGEKVFVPSACGGRATCGYCKVKVLEGGGVVLPTEEPFLEAQEQEEGVRLSCAIKVRSDIAIEVPPELLDVREYACRCSKIVDLTHDIKLFRFELHEPQEMDYVPGRYVQLLTPVYPGSKEEVYRAYSIASDPAEKNVVELITRLVPGGICTTWCFEHLQVGDGVRLNGPYGDFGLRAGEAPILFIAGGSGMAPIRNMLYDMRSKRSRRKAVYFFGVNEVHELFMTEQMREFERDLSDFRYVPVVARPGPEDKWEGEAGLVTEAVGRNISDASEYEAYLCGGPGMIDASIEVLKQLGMREENTFYDKFA